MADNPILVGLPRQLPQLATSLRENGPRARRAPQHGHLAEEAPLLHRPHVRPPLAAVAAALVPCLGLPAEDDESVVALVALPDDAVAILMDLDRHAVYNGLDGLRSQLLEERAFCQCLNETIALGDRLLGVLQSPIGSLGVPSAVRLGRHGIPAWDHERRWLVLLLQLAVAACERAVGTHVVVAVTASVAFHLGVCADELLVRDRRAFRGQTGSAPHDAGVVREEPL
mmetsp:Transcript_98647/g.248989  ORF Transcript_98647/g.248989 Transcript_98647/m.248989 type:complete len:227 (+) Transcript_98647:1107-1787(+)